MKYVGSVTDKRFIDALKESHKPLKQKIDIYRNRDDISLLLDSIQVARYQDIARIYSDEVPIKQLNKYTKRLQEKKFPLKNLRYYD